MHKIDQCTYTLITTPKHLCILKHELHQNMSEEIIFQSSPEAIFNICGRFFLLLHAGRLQGILKLAFSDPNE